jgi:CRISPR-associated protein Cas6
MITADPFVDLAFYVSGTHPLWSDHGYALYGAIARVLPHVHQPNEIGILPISGQQVGGRQIQLTKSSRLTLRVASTDIASWLALAGKTLDLGGAKIQVGVPEIRGLIAATALRSRLVTTKNGQDQSRFEAELSRQMKSLGVSDEVIVTIVKRRTVRIHNKEVVGYEVVLEGLNADESIAIQTAGLGGRRHMGCGNFVALQPKI